MRRRQFLRAGAVLTAGSTVGAPAFASAPKPDEAEFRQESNRIYERHWAQTRETVAALKRKYDKPLFGRIRVWDLLDKLALCVDASDYNLGCTNQLIHVRQLVDGMERDGIADEDLYVAALTHDLGKVLLLGGEAPENVVCANRPIESGDVGVGLDHVVFQWNHDEFIYSRLKDHLPDHLAWLVRYHSILIKDAAAYMDERDRRYRERWLEPFRKYDIGTKSMWRLPAANVLDKHRHLIDKLFPRPILF